MFSTSWDVENERDVHLGQQKKKIHKDSLSLLVMCHCYIYQYCSIIVITMFLRAPNTFAQAEVIELI